MSFKEIENGELIVENWKECKLGDIADVLSGYAFKSKDFVDKGIPVIKIKNIIPPIIDITDVEYVNEELYDEKQRYALEYNDVLISMTGSNVNQIASAVGKIGRVRLKNTKMLLNQRVGKLYITDKDQCDYNYLYYYLIQEEVRYNLAASAGGSANQANISPKQIKDINIKLPSIKEQKAIANILSNLDEKIETNNQINKMLEEMAKAIFKQWFVDFEFPNEEGDPYKSSGGEMVESELGMIPKGWQYKELRELCNITSSKRIFMNEYVKEGIPFYRGKEIIEKSKGSLISTELYISIDKYNEIKDKFSVPVKGDILLTSVGTLGIPYKVDYEKFYFKDGNLTWFKDYIQNEYSNYIYLWLLSNEGQSSLESITIGSTQKALTIASLKKLKLMIPNDLLLKKFESVISKVIDKIYLNNTEKENLIKIRDNLLSKLMSGRIKVPLND